MTDTIDAAGIVAAITRPLVWEDIDGEDYESNERYCSRALTGHFGYFITERAGIYRFRIGNKIYENGEGYRNEAAAQAAAGADYRARIAAALDVGPILALVEAGKQLSAMADGVKSDVKSGHSARGDAASSWMREDDRDFRKELDKAFDTLTAALAAFKEASHG